MGAAVPILGLLLDAVSRIETFVTVFISIYGILIFVYVLASWFPRLPYSLQPVLRFLYDVCEPYLRLFRRLLPAMGPLDLSPFLASAILRRARAECEQLAREAGRIRLILHSALDALDEADELDPEVHDVDDDEARPAEAA